MKTDRELLELAAGALGGKYMQNVRGILIKGCVLKWIPLTDDGDALRLAVKLMMSVEISEYEQSTYAYAGKVPRGYACEMWRDDKDAATRRAITRAAAQIQLDKETK